MNEKVTIICKPLKFYTEIDEEMLFRWLKKIRSINEIKGIGRELHLYFMSDKISNKDLVSLMGLFKRYRFNNAKQLKIFMNKSNKNRFYSAINGCWHINMYPVKPSN